MQTKRVSFLNAKGIKLSAKLECPIGKGPYRYAIFAHVFTGNKNLLAAKYISQALTLQNIAVLKFDFTGLGQSEGDFSETNFSTNVEDILAAAKYLKENHEEASLLVGHSLGGAAVIFAGQQLDAVKAIATIGAPFHPEHVSKLIGETLEEIEANGSGIITVDGRAFTIKKHFIEDLRQKNPERVLKTLDKALLLLHSPQDRVVGIENAAKIYQTALHPKSFVTLDGANHMLNNSRDACYAGEVIASWAKRYIPAEAPEPTLTTMKQVVVRLGDKGFTTDIKAGRHLLVADEPTSVGGDDLGLSTYELLNASLGACTAMTMQLYAKRKKWDLKEVQVHLDYNRDYFDDCDSCEDERLKLDHFVRHIEIKGDLSKEQRVRLMQIADKCPVHKTLTSETKITTDLIE